MFPFWKIAVFPVLQSIDAKRIVEIGALRGENTELMIADLGSDVELHVIDPVPEFDPAEHEQRWPGRYVFHRALSLDVLSDLPAMDAAIIDGDHNWYTVRNELQQLTDVARDIGKPMPLMILHDVGWPYGRRDLYYDPDTIPAEYRQPYARAGMLPGRSELAENGGLNPDMANALVEGGARNGVMTAVDDFVADHDKPIRVVFLPVYFGLAILVEESVLATSPKLRWHIDRLEGERGKQQMMEMAERTRLRAMVFQHAMLQRADRRAQRLVSRLLDAAAAVVGSDAAAEARSMLDALDGAVGDIAAATAPAAALACVYLDAHESDGSVLVVDDSAIDDARMLVARLGLDDNRLTADAGETPPIVVLPRP